MNHTDQKDIWKAKPQTSSTNLMMRWVVYSLSSITMNIVSACCQQKHDGKLVLENQKHKAF